MDAPLITQKGPICSALSLQAGEPLIATATQTSVYLLLEYYGAWEAKAFEQSDLPDPVKAALGTTLKQIPGSRLLFIRRSAKPQDGGIHFFLASLDDGGPALYGFLLSSYQELLDLDSAGVLAGDSQAGNHRLAEPLFVVCVNGKRDPCCARFGTPFYTEMNRIAPQSVWQCTHLGGHRFAANLVCLPHGLFYGRLRPEDAVPAVESYRNGEILLPHLRGRACYPEVAQAAEAFLHEHTGDMGVDSFHWLDSVEEEPGVYAVQFRSRRTEEIHRLQVAVESGPGHVIQSCGTDKTSPVLHYRLLGLSQVFP